MTEKKLPSTEPPPSKAAPPKAESKYKPRPFPVVLRGGLRPNKARKPEPHK